MEINNPIISFLHELRRKFVLYLSSVWQYILNSDSNEVKIMVSQKTGNIKNTKIVDNISSFL